MNACDELIFHKSKSSGSAHICKLCAWCDSQWSTAMPEKKSTFSCPSASKIQSIFFSFLLPLSHQSEYIIYKVLAEPKLLNKYGAI